VCKCNLRIRKPLAFVWLLVCSFEAEQFSVLEADSSEGLYKILETEKVDLITMDVVLERENGLDLVRDLRKLSEP